MYTEKYRTTKLLYIYYTTKRRDVLGWTSLVLHGKSETHQEEILWGVGMEMNNPIHPFPQAKGDAFG